MRTHTIIIGAASAAASITGGTLALGSPPEHVRGPVPGGVTIHGKTNGHVTEEAAYAFDVTRRAKIVARVKNTTKEVRGELQQIDATFLGAGGDDLTILHPAHLLPGERGRVVRKLRPGRYYLELAGGSDKGLKFKFRLEPASAIATP